ncbi:MAG: hypothetical protein G01um101430_83 [Parcubacteria group bacterium Gr01-1014_30]|nr:MAG: hypothetical protein G01um101430_83 [Parcubacteria group bacterium Gr01-1014_30]
MPYTVPQFIEREAKIAGPFTFRQLGFLVGAGAIATFFFFLLPFFLFLVATLLLAVSALALSFLKIERVPLHTVAKNFFTSLAQPRLYLWKQKAAPPRIIKEARLRPELPGEATLKVVEKGILNKLSSFLHTKAK